MMGRQRRDQGRLFYEFRLEDRIPENHLLRRMNVFVTVALADLHKRPLGTRIVDAFSTKLDAHVETKQFSGGYRIELTVPLPAPS